jgi:ATP-binding cassette subfamily B protein
MATHSRPKSNHLPAVNQLRHVKAKMCYDVHSRFQMKSFPMNKPYIATNRRDIVFIFSEISHYKVTTLIVVTALFITSLTTIAVPVMLGSIIDSEFSQYDISHISLLFKKILLIIFILSFATGVRFYYVSWLGERIVANLRQRLFRRLLYLPQEFYDSNSPAETVSRLTTDMVLIDDVIGSILSVGLRNIVVGIVGTAYLFTISAPLAGLVIFLLPFVIVTASSQGESIRRLSVSAQNRLASVGARAYETMQSIRVVQAFGQEYQEESSFSAAVDSTFNEIIQRVKKQAIFSAFIIIAIFSVCSIILFIALRELSNGLISRGEVSSFFLAGAVVAEALSALAEVYNTFVLGSGAITRVTALLNEGNLKPNRPLLKHWQTAESNAISFKNVSFSYGNEIDDAYVLEGINIDIKPSQIVAIVGKSGSGKSTLLDLVARFREPTSGEILIDKRNIKDISLQELRREISIVFQETRLLSTTVRENVAYGCPHANDEEVWAALHAANASQFIRKMPLGLDTQLTGGGSRLSGGERQRLAIARAMLQNSKILLLDEATSALDAESERLVQEGLERLMHGRTVLIVAHRLVTVRKADFIVVLDHGHIIEAGKHNELVVAGGLYSQLSVSQFLSTYSD